jgi:hypothetical protein
MLTISPEPSPEPVITHSHKSAIEASYAALKLLTKDKQCHHKKNYCYGAMHFFGNS